MNSLSEGGRTPGKDGHPNANYRPTSAVDDLKAEVETAGLADSNGRTTLRAMSSSINSRAELAVAAKTEAVLNDPGLAPEARFVLDAATAKQWAKLDNDQYLRLRSKVRKADAIGVIAGNARISSEYATALELESPANAAVAKGINDEIASQERTRALMLAESSRTTETDAARAARLATFDQSALDVVAKIRERETAEVSARLRADAAPLLQQGDIVNAQRAVEQGTESAAQAFIPNDLRGETVAQKVIILKRPIVEAELPAVIRRRFIVSQQQDRLFDKGKTDFTFRDGANQGEIAFSDVGKQLVTTRHDKETIAMMLDVAKAKNWTEITLSGTNEFRRQAWIDANRAGIEARGYEPNERDNALLRELQKLESQENCIVEAGRSQVAGIVPASAGKHVDGDELTPKARQGLQDAKAMLVAKNVSDKFIDATMAELRERVQREQVFVGKVIEQGAAPYQFVEGNNASSYVKLQTVTGEQTVWGKEIQKSLKDANVKPGDEIALRKMGSQSVSVKDGAPDGPARKDALRNQWVAEPMSQYLQRTNAQTTVPREPRTPEIVREPSRGR